MKKDTFHSRILKIGLILITGLLCASSIDPTGNTPKNSENGFLNYKVTNRGASAILNCDVEADNNWTYKAPMPTARGFLGTCVLNGKIYAIGGATSPMKMTSAVEVYDPISDTWVQKANMPIALCYPNVCTLDGKIYVFGGSTAILGGVVTNSFVYNPDSDEWTQISDSPRIGDPCVAVAEGKVYLIGGAKEGAVPVSDVTMYDPLSNTWTKKTDMPTPRSMLTACIIDNKIYAIGGTNENWGTTFYPNVEEYDPVLDKWTIKPDMPMGRWSPAACAFNNRIYITGGHNRENGVNRVDILDPLSDEWTIGDPMQQIRKGHEACVVNGKLYVIGGFYADNGMPKMLSSVEVYDIEAHK